MFKFAAIFICIAAVASYINYRYIKLPSSIGLMIVGLISPLVALAVNAMTEKKWFYWCGAAVSLIAVAVCLPIARL